MKEATSAIPIVFATVGDPVGAGLVQSIARPGGNVTGLSGQTAELKGKQLDLLNEVAPGPGAVGILLNPDTPYGALSLAQLLAAASANGTAIKVLEIRTPGEFSEAAVGQLVQAGIKSLFVVED